MATWKKETCPFHLFAYEDSCRLRHVRLITLSTSYKARMASTNRASQTHTPISVAHIRPSFATKKLLPHSPPRFSAASRRLHPIAGLGAGSDPCERAAAMRGWKWFSEYGSNCMKTPSYYLYCLWVLVLKPYTLPSFTRYINSSAKQAPYMSYLSFGLVGHLYWPLADDMIHGTRYTCSGGLKDLSVVCKLTSPPTALCWVDFPTFNKWVYRATMWEGWRARRCVS